MIALSIFAANLLFTQAPPKTMTFIGLEKSSGGRLGVFAVNTKNGRAIGYRADERFPVCSTFKVLAVGAILKRVDVGNLRLDKRVFYTQRDLLKYSPVTQAHLKEGSLPIMMLCMAAIEESDNTAANLLLKELGGPGQVSQFCRILGDPTTRLDRIEPALNSGLPGDPRDTSTPKHMADNISALMLDSFLSAASKRYLTDWLVDCKTSPTLLRAGLPKDWRVADKSGMGGPDNSFGASNTRNDIAVIWPPNGRPIVIAAYLTGCKLKATDRDAVLAKVGSIVAKAFTDK